MTKSEVLESVFQCIHVAISESVSYEITNATFEGEVLTVEVRGGSTFTLVVGPKADPWPDDAPITYDGEVRWPK